MTERVSDHVVELQDSNGDRHPGRMTGQVIGQDDQTEVTFYLTDDQLVMVYDPRDLKLTQVPPSEIETVLRHELTDDDEYARAMAALGLQEVDR